MKWLHFLVALLLATSTGSAVERPNIVWIVGEDMGPELGCYGDSYSRTPNLDLLANEGARFTRCFTHAPLCAPSSSQDLGAVPERELVDRGLVADKLTEYEKRVKPLPQMLQIR